MKYGAVPIQMGLSILRLAICCDWRPPGVHHSLGLGPFNGSYSPEGNLSDLIGEGITGTWTLEVTDGYERDEGELLSWTLLIDVLNSDEINIDDEPQVF